jgi:hypothetical protein
MDFDKEVQEFMEKTLKKKTSSPNILMTLKIKVIRYPNLEHNFFPVNKDGIPNYQNKNGFGK